jgi:hypothetical protein
MGSTELLLPIFLKIHILLISFCCIFRPFYQLLYKRPTAICSKMPKTRNKPDTPDSQQISVKGMYGFLQLLFR